MGMGSHSHAGPMVIRIPQPHWSHGHRDPMGMGSYSHRDPMGIGSQSHKDPIGMGVPESQGSHWNGDPTVTGPMLTGIPQSHWSHRNDYPATGIPWEWGPMVRRIPWEWGPTATVVPTGAAYEFGALPRPPQATPVNPKIRTGRLHGATPAGEGGGGKGFLGLRGLPPPWGHWEGVWGGGRGAGGAAGGPKPHSGGAGCQ